MNHIQKTIKAKLIDALSNNLSAIESIQAFIRTMAIEVGNSEFQDMVPLGFWVAAETSTVSNSALRNACQAVFTEWTQSFASKLVQEGFAQGKANDLAILIVSMIEGAAILTITQKDNKPLLLVVEQIPAILKKS